STSGGTELRCPRTSNTAQPARRSGSSTLPRSLAGRSAHCILSLSPQTVREYDLSRPGPIREMNELHRALLELQELDREITDAEKRIDAFDHRMVTLSAPVAALEEEAKALRKRASVLD